MFVELESTDLEESLSGWLEDLFKKEDEMTRLRWKLVLLISLWSLM